jgi:phasin family protein
MATRTSKSPAARKPGAAKPATAKPRAKAAPKAAPKVAASAIPTLNAGSFAMPDPAQFAKFAKAMTPGQAFDLYKTNAKMALEIINAAIENTAKVRKLQFEGEEQARSMQKKVARHAAEAGDAQSLMAAGQSAAQEAVQQSMQYWGQMFELIADMQKRLFTLMEAQMSGVPGVREAKAAMAMLPDLTPAKNLVAAMQGMMTSGGSSFESMQRAMGEFAKFAQQAVPGIKR